jgi:hypothetical protein
MSIFTKCLRAVVFAGSFLLPVAVSAATPQESLDAAMRRNTNEAVRMEGSLTLTISERPYVRGGESTSGTVRFRINQRALPMVDGRQDAEGQFIIDSIRFSGASNNVPFPLEVSEPIVIGWKAVNKVVYLRVEQLPIAFVDFLRLQGGDPSAIVGKWISIDLTEALALRRTSSVEPTDLPQLLLNRSLLRVVRVEKREVRADGHTILRLRARVNYTTLYALQREEIRRVDRTQPGWYARVTEINKAYAELRRFFARVEFVAVVDETENRLQRLEIGGSFSEPQKTCTWNYTLRRSLCRTTSLLTYRFLGGFSFAPDAGNAVDIPAEAVTLEELFTLLIPPPVFPTSTVPLPEPPLATSTVTTTTTP